MILRQPWVTLLIECELDVTNSGECEIDVSRPAPKSHEILIETVSVSPQVFIIHNCLSEDETDFIVDLVDGKLARSCEYEDLYFLCLSETSERNMDAWSASAAVWFVGVCLWCVVVQNMHDGTVIDEFLSNTLFVKRMNATIRE